MRSLNLSLLFLGVLLSFNVSGSHVFGSYYEHRVDPVNNTWEVQFHLFRNFYGFGSAPANVTLQGPLTIALNRVGSGPLDTVEVEDINCGGFIYEEYLYTAIVPISTLPLNASLTPLEFTIGNVACCVADYKNIDALNTYNTSTSVTIYPKVGVNGQLTLEYFDNIGTTPMPLQAAFPYTTNYNSFQLLPGMQGADSVAYELVNPKSTPSQNIGFAAGYTALAPFPDYTEDTLNGPCLHFPQQNIISTKVIPGGYQPGFYVMAFEKRYYRTGNLIFKDVTLGMVYFKMYDGTKSIPTVEVSDKDTSWIISDNPEVLQYNLEYGDTLRLQFKVGVGQPGDSLYVFSQQSFVDSSRIPAFVSSGYEFPELKSHNPGGQWKATDTNLVELSFIPGPANFWNGGELWVCPITWRLYACGGVVNGVRVRIQLNGSPGITVNTLRLDTANFCDTKSVQLTSLGFSQGDYWSPGILADDSTAIKTEINPLSSQWIYWMSANGNKRDSIFLRRVPADSIYSLQSTGSSIQKLDADNSLSQVWTMAERVDMNGVKEDQFPIVGAGSYSVKSEVYGVNNCDHYSDTLKVDQDFIWGSNMADDGRYTASVLSTDTILGVYECKIRVPSSVREFEYLYILGLENIKPDVPRKVRVRVFNSGPYLDTICYVGKESYLKIPVDIVLQNWDFIRLEVHFLENLNIQLLENTASSLAVNLMENYEFNEIMPNTPIAVSNYRLPLGYKFKGTIDLDENRVPKTGIRLYPNPGSDYIEVELAEAKENEYCRVYSSQGQLMLEGNYEVFESKLVLAVDQLPNGVYLLHVAGQQAKFRVMH